MRIITLVQLSRYLNRIARHEGPLQLFLRRAAELGITISTPLLDAFARETTIALAATADVGNSAEFTKWWSLPGQSFRELWVAVVLAECDDPRQTLESTGYEANPELALARLCSFFSKTLDCTDSRLLDDIRAGAFREQFVEIQSHFVLGTLVGINRSSVGELVDRTSKDIQMLKPRSRGIISELSRRCSAGKIPSAVDFYSSVIEERVGEALQDANATLGLNQDSIEFRDMKPGSYNRVGELMATQALFALHLALFSVKLSNAWAEFREQAEFKELRERVTLRVAAADFEFQEIMLPRLGMKSERATARRNAMTLMNEMSRKVGCAKLGETMANPGGRDGLFDFFRIRSGVGDRTFFERQLARALT